jgi:hypothetical protein
MLWTGFLLGIMSSFHCVAMCGPIALAIPVPRDTSRFVSIVFYNVGRIITYSLLGLVFGMVGYMIMLTRFQQYLSIVCGAGMLLVGLLTFIGKAPEKYMGNVSGLFLRVKNKFSFLFQKRNLIAIFSIGLLNGLLPCGMVYMALLGSVATGSILEGSGYMVFFGLGTMPVMFFVFYLNTLKGTWRSTVKRLIPLTSVFVGMLLIIRGLNLGIPYISPEVTENEVNCCSAKKVCK